MSKAYIKKIDIIAVHDCHDCPHLMRTNDNTDDLTFQYICPYRESETPWGSIHREYNRALTTEQLMKACPLLDLDTFIYKLKQMIKENRDLHTLRWKDDFKKI